MKRKIECVEEFHRIYKLGNSKKPIGKLKDGLEKLRFDLMAEENGEYLEAAKKGNVVEVADALGDMLYILCGTIIEEIHRSNLSKLDENGDPIYREDGKVIKGPNYFPPNLKKFFEK